MLRLVRHLPLRADDRVPSLLSGRCCISLEGRNRGERHDGRSQRRLWRLSCEGVVMTLSVALGRLRTDDGDCGDVRATAAAVPVRRAPRGQVQAHRKTIYRTPGSASSGLPTMQRRHGAGGARIEQSRQKTCSTVMVWPQCAHTKVGAGTAEGSSAASSGGGGATCNNSRASARLARRLPLASSP